VNAISEAPSHTPTAVVAEPDDPSKLDKASYIAIKERLSFSPSPLIVVLILALNISLGAFGIWLLSLGTTPAYLLSQLLFPIAFFQAFSILHECGHGSCTSKSWLNTLIGHYASPLCFIPYFPWKFQHAQHHAWSGNLEKDPSLKLLRDWRSSQRVPLLIRLCWRTWIPLAAAVNHLVFWTYPITVLRTGTPSQLRRCIASLIWMAASYAGVIYAWPAIFSLGNFAPAIVIYLVAVELVNLPHHSDQRSTTDKLALWEQAYSTRSCYYPKLVSELLVLNFNFHIEHHLFPTLPWYRLRTARALIKPALGAGYSEAIGIRWNLENRFKDITEVLRARESAPEVKT
jgi:acyl-lipid omega-6 desaturase (Delta-12 desaturase)